MSEMSPAEEVFFAALEKATPAAQAAYLADACSRPAGTAGAGREVARRSPPRRRIPRIGGRSPRPPGRLPTTGHPPFPVHRLRAREA